MKVIRKNIIFTILFWINSAILVVAQSLETITNQLEGQKTNIKGLADVILWILLVISFIYMLTNLIFKYQEQKNSVVTFIVVLLLFGMFKLIF